MKIEKEIRNGREVFILDAETFLHELLSNCKAEKIFEKFIEIKVAELLEKTEVEIEIE